MITNESYDSRMKSRDIQYKGNVITFFRVSPSDKNSYMCLEFPCPIKRTGIIFDSASRFVSYIDALIIKHITGVDITSQVMEDERILGAKTHVRNAISGNRMAESLSCLMNKITLWVVNYIKFGYVKYEGKIANTGNSFIAYCNPNDKELGCFENKESVSKRTCCLSVKGKNKLGCAIMQVRDDINMKKSNTWTRVGHEGECTIAFSNVILPELFSLFVECVMDLYDVEYNMISIPDSTKSCAVSIKMKFNDDEYMERIKNRISEYPMVISI